MRKISIKKHDMTMLYEFILLVAVIAIVALLVFQIGDDVRIDITSEDRTTLSVINESVTPTDAGTTFATDYRDSTCGIITAVYNATGSIAINSGNYTQSGCILTNTTSTFTVGAWKVSYPVDYAIDSLRYNATLDNDTAVAKIPKSLKLLATAVIFGAVLYVIMRVLPVKRENTFQ